MRLEIAKWAETYESSTISSRPKKGMPWFQMPTESNGTGRKMLERHPEGMAFYGIWCALCEITARLPEAMRGKLVRGNGEPYSVQDLHLLIGGCDLKLFENAVSFFLAPRPGWLIDLDAKAAAPARRVVDMPLPKIEEPSIYEAAADRMLALYTEAGAPLKKLMGRDEVSRALMTKLEAQPTKHHAESIELIAYNMAAMLEESDKIDMVLRIDNFIRSGPCLAPRKSRKPERGSTEALIVGEVKAGRMTVEQAKEQGVYL